MKTKSQRKQGVVLRNTKRNMQMIGNMRILKMNKLLTAALILISSNCFAYDDSNDLMSRVEEQNRQQELERRIDNMEQQKRFDDSMKQFDDITTKGWR